MIQSEFMMLSVALSTRCARRRLPSWVLALLFLLGLGGVTPAQAANTARKAKKVPWVVLVYTQGEVPASWAPALRAAAQRDQDRTWIPPPVVSMEEVQSMLGCAQWDRACAAQCAGISGAQFALMIEVIRTGAGASVTIEGVSAAGAATRIADSVKVDDVDASALMIAEAWVLGAVTGRRPTVLMVSANVEGTEVVIDDEPFGITPLTLVDQVGAGDHVLVLRKKGRAPLSRTMHLTAGSLNREHGVWPLGEPTLQTDGVVGVESGPAFQPVPVAPVSGVSAVGMLGWGLAGVGAVVAVAGVFGGSFAQIEVNDFHSNVKDGVISTRYSTLLHGTFAGNERFGFLSKTFGVDRESITFNQDLADAVGARQGEAVTFWVVAATGALVAGVGAAVAALWSSAEPPP